MRSVLPLALFASLLSAQEYRATISGKVTDPQGASVPGAKVVATESRTGTKTSGLSEASGAYTIPFLAPGDYQLDTELTGFKHYARKGLTLNAGEHPVIDIALEVGSQTESVTVSAESPLIVSANASIGQTVTTQEVEDFPVNGRTPLMLDNLAMGVISTFEPGPVRPFDNSAPTSVSMGGAPSGTNESLLNGAPNAGFANALAYSPPQDAVEEVRVNAFESDAAYGHTMGGVLNQITKSGTNSIHGSAYEFNQTSALDANSFFTNKAGNPRPPYHYNQYGLTVGGPVWLPKIYNGKNKLFWFFAYEGLKDSDPANSPLETGNPVNFATVPTAAERQGDFSALLALNNGTTNYTIYDPATGVTSGTQTARTPFPNNIIPANRLNAIALNYLQYFPLPNTPGKAGGFNNYVVNAIDTDGYDNELGRLDYNLSDNQKLSFDYRHNYRTQDKNKFFPNDSSGTFLYRINQGTALDYIQTITPTLVMDIRANWTRYMETHASPSDGFDITKLGFPANIAAASEAPAIPFITFNSCSVTAGSSLYYQCLGASGDSVNTFDVYQAFGDIVKFKGNHTLKIGADIRDSRWSAYTHGNSAGTYTFNSNFTGGPFNNSAAAPLGQEFAAFLLGLPSSGSIDLNSQSTTGSKYLAFFVQEDWRARNNLTINAGLRWDHDTPATERYNRATNGFDPTAANPISAAAAAAYALNPLTQIPGFKINTLGGLTYPSSSNRDLYKTPSAIFSPRLGVAWVPKALGGATVIRAGFGMFVSPIGIIGNQETGTAVTLNQQGFSQTTQYVATNNNYLTPANSFSNPFPGGVLTATGAAGGTGTFLGQAVPFFNPNVRNPYSMRWDFSIQRQLPGAMVLEIAYIGNHSVHLPITTQLDFIPRQYLSTSPTRDTAAIAFLNQAVPNPFKGLLPNSSALNGATVALSQLLVPFPQYPAGSGTSNGVQYQSNGAGESYFSSMNVRVQKRFTHGVTLINNFIYSKLIDRLAYLNDSDPAPEKRVSSDSRPLREVLAGSYQFPIGSGKKFDLHSRIGNSLAGGWTMNGIMTFQSGSPLTFGNVIYYGGPLHLNAHQPNGLAFDTAQFNTASTQQLASNIRTFDTQFNNLRRDPTKNVDLSLLKNFTFAERKYLQVRFETFNTTNRVTFGVPNTTPTNANFGLITTQANTPRRVQVGARLVW